MFLDIDRHESDMISVIDDTGNRVTYGELVDAVYSFYTEIKPRTVAFILSKNCVDALIGYIGMINKNVVPLILDDKMEPGLLQKLISQYKPRYIYAPVDHISLDYGRTVFEKGNYALAETSYDVYPLNDKLQFLMTTSGSTGSPKLVRYKAGNLEINAKNVAKSFKWTSAERAICDLGMQYTMGLNVINTHLYVGATVLLTNHNIMGSEYWDFVREYCGTNFTGVPFSYEILHRLQISNMDVESIRTFSQGGGKLTDLRFKEFAEFCAETGRRFIASFGTTETSARMCMLDPELATQKTGSIGKAISEGYAFIVNEDGEIISDPNVQGELCYKGPNVTMGYASCPEDLAKGDGWRGEYHTGDLAYMDQDGCFYISGRKGRFLKLLGHRVGLDECELMIGEAFNCGCACIGNDNGMRIFVDAIIDTDEIVRFISEKLGLYKSLFLVNHISRIPRNDRGKVDYIKLDQ